MRNFQEGGSLGVDYIDLSVFINTLSSALQIGLPCLQYVLYITPVLPFVYVGSKMLASSSASASKNAQEFINRLLRFRLITV